MGHRRSLWNSDCRTQARHRLGVVAYAVRRLHAVGMVNRACHALSLDDERTAFHPLLWDEAAEAEMVRPKDVRPAASRRCGLPACIPMSAAVTRKMAVARAAGMDHERGQGQRVAARRRAYKASPPRARPMLASTICAPALPPITVTIPGKSRNIPIIRKYCR